MELITQFHKYQIGYTNKEEFKLLCDEIFNKEIYKTKLTSKSPIIFDLGAHIGLATIYFKEKYPNSHVYSFEPNPNIFPILEENITFNRFEDVSLFNIALGNKEEERTFYIDNTGKNCFSTSGFNKNAWNGKQSTVRIKVKTDKLSKYITQPIDLLKVDIEGAETEVLKELSESKKLELVKKIIIEYHPVNQASYHNLVKLLNTHMFTVEIKKDAYGENLVDILGENIAYKSI